MERCWFGNYISCNFFTKFWRVVNKNNKSIIMNQLTFVKIQACFKELRVSEKDYLSHQQLYVVISKLNAESFDLQTFEQLWDQCTLNSKGQAKVADFINYVIKAENILVEKLRAIEISIAKHAMGRPLKADFSQQRRFQIEEQELHDEKSAIKNSIAIVSKPFQLSKILANSKLTHKQQVVEEAAIENLIGGKIKNEEVDDKLFEYDGSKTVDTLTAILYWLVVLVCVNVVGAFMLNRFVDFTLSLVLLSSFCFESIGLKIVRLNLILLGFSIVYTFLWLIIYTDRLWQPVANDDYTTKVGVYLKISIVLIMSSIAIKLVLCWNYLSLYHIQENQIFTVVAFSKTFFMKYDANILNPPKNPLVYALRHVMTKTVEPSEQPSNQV